MLPSSTARPFLWSGVVAAAALLTAIVGMPPAVAQQPAIFRPAGPAPLFLYHDDVPLGELYAKALHSWLGHFRLNVTRRSVGRYRAGEMRDAAFVAYIGSVFDNPSLPEAFLDDVADGIRPVLWMHYNIWKLAWRAGSSRLGFVYESTDDRRAFAAVYYKGVVLPRDPRTDLVRVRPVAPWAKVLAVARGKAGEESPYAVWARNVLYIADPAFSYLANADRSLVLADILHDFLEQPHDDARHALIRIEDVHPGEQVPRLRWIDAYLASERVPYSIALIPVSVDRWGRVTRLSDQAAAPMAQTIRAVVAKGARLMLHGFTHQYDGFTPTDWEFWDERSNRPVGGAEYAAGRVRQGMEELAAVNLRPYGWVTPHYMASEEHYAVFARLLPIAYERQFFFDSRAGGLLLFYPYPSVDIFGRFVIPETLESPRDIGSVEEILQAAERLKTVRCGVASAYIHIDQVRQDHRALVSGMRRSGFRFVGVGVDSPIWRFLLRF